MHFSFFLIPARRTVRPKGPRLLLWRKGGRTSSLSAAVLLHYVAYLLCSLSLSLSITFSLSLSLSISESIAAGVVTGRGAVRDGDRHPAVLLVVAGARH